MYRAATNGVRQGSARLRCSLEADETVGCMFSCDAEDLDALFPLRFTSRWFMTPCSACKNGTDRELSSSTRRVFQNHRSFLVCTEKRLGHGSNSA